MAHKAHMAHNPGELKPRIGKTSGLIATTTERDAPMTIVDWPSGHIGYEALGEHEARALRCLGLRPHPRHHHYPCPRIAAGKHCLGARCVCERHHLGILDHCRGWKDSRGRTVITAEPYGFSAAELADLIVSLYPLGVRVHVCLDSLWYPGHTALLVMSREDVTS
jgi:hypothetical protein